MESDNLIKLFTDDLKSSSKVIINPIVDPSIILEKVERKIIYIPSFQRYYEVFPKTYVFPIFLPEIGILLSMEVTSKDLAKSFYGKISDFEGVLTKGKMLISNVYNLNPQANRMVSWGNIRSFDLSEDLYQIYLTNLISDFLITPSIVSGRKLLSPVRWFYLSSSYYNKFEAVLHYNVGVIYLHKNFLLERKIKYAWINSPTKLYEVKAGFIVFHPEGYLKYVEPIFLHFLSDPLEMQLISSDRGDYFLSFLISFNKYSTSYGKSNVGEYINIVDTLTPLVFSPWDILPLLFPSMMTRQELDSLLFKFRVNENIFLLFQKRLMKFGAQQNRELIEAYENFIQQKNRTISLTKAGSDYIVKIVNPLIIPFLLKKIGDPQTTKTEKSFLEKMLLAPDFMNKIEELNAHRSEKIWWHFTDFRQLLDIGPFLKLRGRIIKDYISIARDVR